MDDEAGQPDDGSWQELSLEELGQAYAHVVARTTPATAEDYTATDDSENPAEISGQNEATGFADEADATLASIIEGALFIGHTDGRSIRESELAVLMRDVTEADIKAEIGRLNDHYESNEQALRILRDADGIRLGVADDLETIRRAFYGKVRETTLSQGAVEVLSLVAYQPGITGEKVQDQRGKESVSLLSQLVRRRLLELKRIREPESSRTVSTYYPTQRFLELFGLESLDDLPQVEE